MKWAFCDVPLGCNTCYTSANTACLGPHHEENISDVYLLVWEAHGCIKQRDILLIVQCGCSAARISIFAATNKPAVSTRPQGHELPLCFASKQLLTTGEPQLLLFWLGL